MSAARALDAPRGGLPARLARFVLERFPPLSYGLLVVALALAGQAAANLALGAGFPVSGTIVLVTIAIALGFLQLRILDEIRDEATDRLGRPDRPLPRGLVSVGELRALAVASALAGLVTAGAAGPATLGWYLVALAQVWILGLGMGRGLAPHGGVGEALGHSLIVPTMLAVAWTSAAPLVFGASLAAALALAWGAGLALEVGRKTFAPSEERAGIETYSASLGRPRALALVGAFLAASAAGAAAMASASGASVQVVTVPIVVVGAVVAAAAVARDALTTGVIQATVSILVLAALLWPPVLALGLR